jgi:hypothetical protein
MSLQLKQIEAAARALKLKLPFTPDCDPAHDLVDRIIHLCSQSAQVDPALALLEKNHEGVVGASVIRYQLDERWLAVGIPRHQPFGQQIDWCTRKGVANVEIVIEIHTDEKRTQLYQTNNINDFKI